MERYKKRYVNNGIIIPTVISVILTVLFFVILNLASGNIPFVKDTVEVASYDSAEISRAEQLEISDNSISRSKAKALDSNTTFGSISIGQTEYPLIYDANEVNAMGKFNMETDSIVIGDVGSAFLSCYKSDSAGLKALKAGDIINIETHYGSFVYQVVDTKSAAASKLDSVGDGIGKALVLYTDGTKSVGISNRYFCVICRMVSGTEITQ